MLYEIAFFFEQQYTSVTFIYTLSLYIDYIHSPDKCKFLWVVTHILYLYIYMIVDIETKWFRATVSGFERKKNKQMYTIHMKMQFIQNVLKRKRTSSTQIEKKNWKKIRAFITLCVDNIVETKSLSFWQIQSLKTTHI